MERPSWSKLGRYLLLIVICAGVLLLFAAIALQAMWDDAFSSGCWGFPGEDCS